MPQRQEGAPWFVRVCNRGSVTTATDTYTSDIARLTRERDEALADFDRLAKRCNRLALDNAALNRCVFNDNKKDENIIFAAVALAGTIGIILGAIGARTLVLL